MFRLDLKEYKPHPEQLYDYLPWMRFCDCEEAVIGLKQTGLMRTLTYRGLDTQSLAKEDLASIATLFNRALRQLGEGFAIFVETANRYGQPVCPVDCDIPVVHAIEHERAMRHRDRLPMEKIHYITLTYIPPRIKDMTLLEKVASLFGGLYNEDEGNPHTRGEVDIGSFIDSTNMFFKMIKPVCSQIDWLDHGETLTFLQSCCSDVPMHIENNQDVLFIDSFLGGSSLESGTRLRLGRQFMHVVTIKGYPNFSEPKLMHRLKSLDFEYRMVSRFLSLSPDEAAASLGWFERYTVGDYSYVQERVKNEDVVIGYHSLMVIVWSTDPEQAKERAKRVEAAFHLSGFKGVVEGTPSFGAWLSTMPGHVWSNPRRALITSKNLSHMINLSSDWQGEEVSTHLGYAPHLYTRTQQGGLYRLNLNVGDVGHTMILGPTGAGKSTLLSLLQLQWLKYPNSRVITFDKGRSSRAPCLAAGGVFMELGDQSKDQGLRFQPLKHIDKPNERAWAKGWLTDLYRLEGITLRSEQVTALQQALEAVATSPPHARTLSKLALLLQDATLEQGLAPYCRTKHGTGDQAWLWDNSDEHLGTSRWLGFEMSTLMERGPSQTTSVLTYLFHRLEAQFSDKTPTLLVLDEAWIFLSNSLFSKRIKNWLKVLRKANVYVVFATQDINDALSSDIAPTLVSNCKTKVLLPNVLATKASIKPHYQSLGLPEPVIRLLASEPEGGIKSKLDYYIHNELGGRLFNLDFDGAGLDFALCTANSHDDHALMDRLLAVHGPGQAFARAFVEALGHPL